jgi:hypothetical protein
MVRTERLVGLFVVGVCVTSCAADDSTLTNAAVRGNLRQVAHGIARRAGVDAPASMVAVAAPDHQAAAAVVSGALIADHSPVYVVQMTGGTFTATRHPRGQPAPRGNVLTITFDAATLQVTDVGYDSIAPDLTKIDAQPVDLLAL